MNNLYKYLFDFILINDSMIKNIDFMKKIKTIVFPVGGLGTRFLPATKAVPKEMLPVAEKPLIQYAFEEAIGAGVENFIFITGRNKDTIESHFDNNYELQEKLQESNKIELLKKTIDWLPSAGNIFFTRQQNTRGLGHAVLCARKIIKDEPFAVTLADELFYKKDGNVLKDMIDLYEKQGGNCNVLAVQEVAKENVSKYGIVAIEKIFENYVKINEMVEKPKVEEAPSNLSATGKYIFEPGIFDYLENTKEGVGGEIQLTDAIKEMLKNTATFAYKVDAERFDCGSIVGYLKANISFALNNEKISKEVKDIIAAYYEKTK
ncbi:MAG: UTP--glucose-1-phosphate uridylyltransferase GalU [Rickettsiales bacterium]|jgi:UTP--glucose-1-phosphate uridylyltransferase|nr:UTP--glucose-1-phosphate uridylyltransferase GalU [Rickettsiales bacterium]